MNAYTVVVRSSNGATSTLTITANSREQLSKLCRAVGWVILEVR